MARATTAFHNRIGLAFDFDETLAPTTFPHVLEHCGYEDADAFVAEHITPLVENHNWETPLARTHALMEALRRDGKTLHERELVEIGRRHPLYDGVPEMFGRVRDRARAIVEDIDVRFYLITAGFAEVPENTSIAKEFDAVFGGAWAFDDERGLVAAKRLLTDREKISYLMLIAKGFELENANPEDIWRPRDPSEWSMPIDQMIFVGDGSSDMPAFGFMREHGGAAIGVYHGDEAKGWAHHDETHPKRRVENLAPGDYSEGSEMLESLLLAVDGIASRVALRRRGNRN